MRSSRRSQICLYADKWLLALSPMPSDLKLAYLMVCLMIYDKRGPIAHSNESFGRLFGFRPSHAGHLVEKLIGLGKLNRLPDGRLMNPFAERELSKWKREELSPAGKSLAENNNKINEGVPTIDQNLATLSASILSSLPSSSSVSSSKEERKKESKKERRARARRSPAPSHGLDLGLENYPQVNGWPVDYQTQFWKQYPRRVAKGTAMKALDVIRKSGSVTFADLMVGVSRYAGAVSSMDLKYVKHPATWLNAACWHDDARHINPEEKPKFKDGYSAVLYDFMEAERAEKEANGGQ